MNLLNEDDGYKSVYTTKSKLIIVLSIIFTIFVGYYTKSLDLLILSSSSVLIVTGVITTIGWNNELKEDGYASLIQLYTFYLAVIFLFIAVLPILSQIVGFALSITMSIGISFLYAIVLNTIAFYNIDEDDHNFAVDTYEGTPSVVYLKKGPYMEHIEEIAKNEDMKENSDNKES